MSTKILKTILFFVLFVNIVKCLSVPKSSCPNVFRYYKDGSQWIGVIRLPSNSRDSVFKLTISMTISATLSSSYIGTLDLFGERNEVMRRIASGSSIGYKVIFPTQEVLPVITSIILNGIEYCHSQASFSGSGSVTSITLNHVLFSERITPSFVQQDSVIDDPNFASDDVVSNIGPVQNQNFGNDYSSIVRPTQDQNINNNFGNGNTVSNNRPNQNQNIDVGYSNNYTDSTIRPVQNQNPLKRPVTNADQYNYGSNPFLTSGTKISNNQRPTKDSSNDPETFQNSKPVKDSYECGVSKKVSNSLIVGGDTTARGEWPWLSAIFMKKVASLQFICSGSLISHQHVVTAAHCVVQKRKQVSKDDLILKFGSHNIQDWADDVVKTMETEEVIVHPQFDFATLLKNDIAILKVTNVEYTDYIIPVCLWRGNDDLNLIVGQSGTVIGWGRDENGLMATPEPRLAKVPIVSTDTCRASREEFFKLTSETTMCAGGRDGTGPCNGDSGGGLYLNRNGKWLLRGIVSNSLKDTETNSCNLNEYVVFTDASKYNSWIQNIMNS